MKRDVVKRMSLRARVRRLLVVLLACGLALPVVSVVPAAAAVTTVVSLTFDDGNASQLAAQAALKKYGMNGTFYAISGYVGGTNYLTLDQLKSIKADGNEIAGHTVSHFDLVQLSANEAKRQVCNDRVNWASWGVPVSDFAYPFASSTPAVEQIAADCGYNTARGLGDIRTRFSCGKCPVAETIPPANAYNTRAPVQVEKTWTLADLKKSVTQAEAKGGWVELTFHQICTGAGCVDPAISPTVLDQFLAWLKARTARGTVVRTVAQVAGGTVKPAVAGPAAPPPTGTTNGIQNPSLETFDPTTGLPKCYLAGGFGSNTPSWSVGTDAHTGTSAVTLTMANYVSGDAKLVPRLDLGECSPTVTPGESYVLGEWYKSTAPTQFAVYYRTSVGTWTYWTSSPWFAATSTYAQAVWTAPPVPSGATGISFGLNLFSNGSLTTDDLSLTQAPAAPAAAGATPPAGLAAAARTAVTSGTAALPVTVDPSAPLAELSRSGPKLIESTTGGDLLPPRRPSRTKGSKILQSHLLPGLTQVGTEFVIAPDPSRG